MNCLGGVCRWALSKHQATPSVFLSAAPSWGYWVGERRREDNVVKGNTQRRNFTFTSEVQNQAFPLRHIRRKSYARQRYYEERNIGKEFREIIETEPLS